MRTPSLLLVVFVLLAGCELIVPSPGADLSGRPVTFRTGGTDEALAAARLPDGDLVLAGLGDGVLAPSDGTLPFPSLYRVAPDGTLRWGYVYDDLAYAESRAVLPHGDGMLLLVSLADSRAAYRGVAGVAVALWAVREDGTLASEVLRRSGWSVAHGAARPLAATRDGGFVLLAEDGEDALAVRLDGAFRTLWTYRLAHADFTAVQQRPDGQFLIAATVVGEGWEDAVVVRLGADGAERQRTRVAGGRPVDLVPVADGYALVANAYRSGTGASDGLAVLLDRNGKRRYAHWVGGVGLLLSAAAPAPDGGFVAVGTLSRDGRPSQAFAVHNLADGGQRWAQWYGGNSTVEGFRAVVARAGGGYALAGFTGPDEGTYGGPDHDVFLVLVDADGTEE